MESSFLARKFAERTIGEFRSDSAGEPGAAKIVRSATLLGRNRIAAHRGVSRISQSLGGRHPHKVHSGTQHAAVTFVALGPDGSTAKGDLGSSQFSGVRACVYAAVAGKKFCGAMAASALTVDRHALERFFDRKKDATIPEMVQALQEAADSAALILAAFLDPGLQTLLRTEGPLPIVIPAGPGGLLGVIRQLSDQNTAWDCGCVEVSTWLPESRLNGDQISVVRAFRELPSLAGRGPGHLARYVALLVEQTPAAARGNGRTERMGPSVHVKGGKAVMFDMGPTVSALHTGTIQIEDAVRFLGTLPKTPRLMGRTGAELARAQADNGRVTYEDHMVQFA